MNELRRKALRSVSGQIQLLRSRLEELRDDEQAAFDNLPESIQDSDRGQRLEDAVESMEIAIDALDEAEESISDAINA